MLKHCQTCQCFNPLDGWVFDNLLPADPVNKVNVAEVHLGYSTFAFHAGIKPPTQNMFTRHLRALGYPIAYSRGGNHITGHQLKTQAPEAGAA